MDALAAGLVFMVLTGILLWFRRSEQRLGGLIALVLGVAVLAFIVIGL